MTRVGILAAGLIALAFATALLVRAGDQVPAQVTFGFNNNAVAQGAEAEGVARMLAALGAEIDRVQIDWATLEPTRGDRRFDRYDEIYEADLRHGVRPMFIFAFAPPWATDAECAAAPAPCHAAPAPEHYDDAARTVAVLAKRYPRAAGIEIWNEPNTPHFWAPTPDPEAYAELLAACYEAIKRVAPEMPVAGGSTSDSPGYVAGHIRAPEFVAGMQDNGAFAHMDALSLHAYPDPADPSTETAVADVEAVRAVLDDPPPIWVTETGVSTTGPEAVADSVQALMGRRLSELLPEIPGVDMVLFHTLIEPPFGAANSETGFGVVHTDLRPKPAYCVLAETWGGDADCP